MGHSASSLNEFAFIYALLLKNTIVFFGPGGATARRKMLLNDEK